MLVMMAGTATRIEAQHHGRPRGGRETLVVPLTFLLHHHRPVRVSVAVAVGGAGGVEPDEEGRITGSGRRRQLGDDVRGRDGRGVARVLVRVGDLEQRWVVAVLLLHQLRGQASLVLAVRASVV